MNSANSERRKSNRVEARFTVACRVDKFVETRMWIGNREVGALMSDLSDLGMAILTKEDVPLLTTLSMNFTLINFGAPDDKRVRSMEITGEIKSNVLAEGGEHRLGIHFTQISREDKQAIVEFVGMQMK